MWLTVIPRLWRWQISSSTKPTQENEQWAVWNSTTKGWVFFSFFFSLLLLLSIWLADICSAAYYFSAALCPRPRKRTMSSLKFHHERLSFFSFFFLFFFFSFFSLFGWRIFVAYYFSAALCPQRQCGLLGTVSPRRPLDFRTAPEVWRLIAQCFFTSTETVQTVRSWEPRMSTSTFAQFPRLLDAFP